MELRPQFRHDADVNALYIRFAEAPVVKTVELGECVYLDLDASGNPLGVEFVDADDFLPYLQRLGGTVDVPSGLFGQSEGVTR